MTETVRENYFYIKIYFYFFKNFLISEYLDFI